MVEEGFACSDVSGTGARADESRTLPCQRTAFVMGDRPVERDRQRADLACGPQPQVDTEDVTVARHLGQQAHDLAGIALGGLARFVALAAGQCLGIVKQDRVDV